MQSCLSSADAAIRSGVSPAAGATPAGTLAVRVADLQVRSRGTVTVTGTAPLKGEMTLFCRPVVAAPARVRRDGTVLADAWLPDLVRLGGLEEHLGDGVIEAIAGKALRGGRLRPRERRRLMSYPLVIRLVIAMTLLPAGGHVIARVKEGIALPFQDTPDRGWLPDGSRVSWLNAPSGKKEDQLPVRVTEHSALVPGPDGDEEASQTCTLISTLLDHEAVPAGEIQEAYLTRWSASETTFGENKATIACAGDRTSGPVLRSGCPQLVLQEAWAWLTAAQLVRAGEAASLRSEAAAARALRRNDAKPGASRSNRCAFSGIHPDLSRRKVRCLDHFGECRKRASITAFSFSLSGPGCDLSHPPT